MTDYDEINNFREIYIPLDKVLNAVNVKDDDVILDIGAGTGFYAHTFSSYLKNGISYAIEINKDAVKNILKIIPNNKNLKIIEKNVCKLEVNGFNKVFFSNVFHDIECREYIFNLMEKNSMRPLKVILIEFNDKSPVGPPLDRRISHEKLKNIFEEKGYKFESHHDLEYNYIDVYSLG